MVDADPNIERLKRLCHVKARPERDLSLAFLAQQFERQVARPFAQMGPIATLWQELVPPHLLAHTKLMGLSRGVLRVIVDSASVHYELDQRLRKGLEQELIARHTGALSRVRLQVGEIDP